MRYRTNNEGTGYRGKHCPVCGQDFDMRDLGQVLIMRSRNISRSR